MTVTHLTGSSASNKAAAVSWPRMSRVNKELKLQQTQCSSRQLANKAPRSIMDDQNSRLWLYDN